MERLEYIESKLSELTPEFKSSIILGDDNVEQTFEEYVRGYVLNTMRDDFTFGDNEIINNLDSLIMLQSSNSGLEPVEQIELPKINKEHMRDVIYEYIREQGYEKYLHSFMDYNDELFGTLETMIEEFLIPNIDDYGNIKEFGSVYPFRKFIDIKIKDHLDKLAAEEEAMREAKKTQLKEKYQEYLNYPTNDFDSSITTFGLYIEKLTRIMDENEIVDVAGRKIKIDRLLEMEIIKCVKKYEDFKNACEVILSNGKGSLDDFKRIALVTNAEVPEGTIIDELLNGILSNIMSKLNEEQIDSLCKQIIGMNIRNKGILNRSLAILKGVDISNLVSELDTSDDILLISKKEILKKMAEDYDFTEEFTVDSAKSVYNEFSNVLDELIALLNSRELTDINRVFLMKMEEYRTSMKTRYIFEDEKTYIVSSYRKLKSQMESDPDVKVNDYYFGFNSIKAKIEELLDMARNIIRISKKDQELFDTMENTVIDLKKLLVEQDGRRDPKL